MDHQRIGRPVRIAMRPEGRLFVRELPEGSPAEIQDPQTLGYLIGDLRVSDIVVTDDDTEGKLGKISIELPIVSPPMPCAIEVHVATRSEPLFDRAIGVIIRDEHNGYGVQSDEANSTSVGKTHGRSELTFRLPSPDHAMAQQLTEGMSVEVTLRSSREAARSAGLEYFLSVPDTNKLVSMTADTKKDAPRK